MDLNLNEAGDYSDEVFYNFSIHGEVAISYTKPEDKFSILAKVGLQDDQKRMAIAAALYILTRKISLNTKIFAKVPVLKLAPFLDEVKKINIENETIEILINYLGNVYNVSASNTKVEVKRIYKLGDEELQIRKYLSLMQKCVIDCDFVDNFNPGILVNIMNELLNIYVATLTDEIKREGKLEELISIYNEEQIKFARDANATNFIQSPEGSSAENLRNSIVLASNVVYDFFNSKRQNKPKNVQNEEVDVKVYKKSHTADVKFKSLHSKIFGFQIELVVLTQSEELVGRVEDFYATVADYLDEEMDPGETGENFKAAIRSLEAGNEAFRLYLAETTPSVPAYSAVIITGKYVYSLSSRGMESFAVSASRWTKVSHYQVISITGDRKALLTYSGALNAHESGLKRLSNWASESSQEALKNEFAEEKALVYNSIFARKTALVVVFQSVPAVVAGAEDED